MDTLTLAQKPTPHETDASYLTIACYILKKYKSDHNFLKAFLLEDEKAISNLSGSQAKLLTAKLETFSLDGLKVLDTCKDALYACEDPVLKVYICSLANQSATILASKALDNSDAVLGKEVARRILEIPEGGRDEYVFVQSFPEVSVSVNKEETLARLRRQLLSGNDRACHALRKILPEDKVQEEVASALLKGAPKVVARGLREKE